MKPVVGWISGAIAALAVLSSAGQARAQTSATFADGQFVTLNGLTMTVSHCSWSDTDVSVNTITCGTLGAEIVASAVSGGVQITIEGAGSGNLFSAATSDPSLFVDISFDIDVTAGPRLHINQAGGSISGCFGTSTSTCLSSASLDSGNLYIGETLTSTSTSWTGSPPPINLDASVGGQIGLETDTLTTPVFGSGTFAAFPATKQLTATKDNGFSVTGDNGLPAPGSFLILKNITQTYYATPEPWVPGLMAASIGALALARRGRAGSRRI